MTARPAAGRARMVNGAARSVAVLGLLALGGLVVLGLAWSRVAGTALVPFQTPALVAGLVGLALVGLGLAAYDVHLGRLQDARQRQALDGVVRQATEVAHILATRHRPAGE